MSPKFPILKQWFENDKLGRVCIVFVNIEQTLDEDYYPPDGIRCVFKVLRQRTPGVEDYEVVLLIDNHRPFGFHEHPKLPEEHKNRRVLNASNWQEAWIIFADRIKGLLDET